MKRKSLGFTLIEIALTLGLITVLAAVALPSYVSYRNRVLSKQAAQQIAAMGASIELYWQNNRAYPSALADAHLDGAKDPWGRLYVYYNVDANGKGGARKDKALNPINTDFDLYSVGADGKTSSQITQKFSLDDVIRASNGKFAGLASDF
jgi:general secretion pathway protein G